MLLKRIYLQLFNINHGVKIESSDTHIRYIEEEKIEIQNNGEPIPDSGLLRTRGDCRRKQARRMGKRVCMKKKKKVCLIELL